MAPSSFAAPTPEGTPRSCRRRQRGRSTPRPGLHARPPPRGPAQPPRPVPHGRRPRPRHARHLPPAHLPLGPRRPPARRHPRHLDHEPGPGPGRGPGPPGSEQVAGALADQLLAEAWASAPPGERAAALRLLLAMLSRVLTIIFPTVITLGLVDMNVLVLRGAASLERAAAAQGRPRARTVPSAL